MLTTRPPKPLIARGTGPIMNIQRRTGLWAGRLPTAGRSNMTQPKSLIVPYKLPLIRALLVDCLRYETELCLTDGPFM
jgi:hypothetical protein